MKTKLLAIILIAVQSASLPAPVFALEVQEAGLDAPVEKKTASASATENPALSKLSEMPLQSPFLETQKDETKPVLSPTTNSQPSAAFRLPMRVQKLLKKHFRLNEKVQFTISNPGNGAITTKVVDRQGEAVPVSITETGDATEKTIQIRPFSQMKPGKYTLRVTGATGETTEQDFTWGVLAINTSKSIYAPQEIAKLSLAVLDEGGRMVCDAKLRLEIRNSTRSAGSGQEFEIRNLTTEDGAIKVNEACQKKDFTLEPDYEATYQVGQVGTYSMTLTAETKNGSYTIADSFEVRAQVPFDIERTGPTRIFPPKTYPVTLTVTANQDFDGTVTEVVPDSFVITPAEQGKSYDHIRTVSSPKAREAVLGAATVALALPFTGDYHTSLGFGEDLIDPYLKRLYTKYGLSGHDGIDFDLPIGTPVFAVDDGEVILAKEKGDYGTTIVLKHSWGRSYYGHLSEIVVNAGHVSKGTQIALSGDTGLTTGPHLHFGIKPTSNNFTNGYYGKIDPLAYFPPEHGGGLIAPGAEQMAVKVLTWNVSLKKGETVTLAYNFKAPNISPQFYTLGPAMFTEGNNQRVFEEARVWQIASDNPGTRVRTVEFFAGQYDGSATNLNENAKQDFATQTFQLAESGADIVDAYVEVSAQIGATTATTYGAAFIYFDACVPTCTPSTTAFTTTAGLGTAGNRSQTIRFRASVTSEAEIAAYTGGAANRTFQVSYCFATGSTCSGTAVANIQAAQAKLVLTYTYDDTSATQTNTVIYPLESATDTGSKTAAQAACTVDTNCPLFSYNANIPELSSQLSQWFYVQASIDVTTTTDFALIPQVDGSASGPTHFFEETLVNNGNLVGYLVDGLTGYANNSAQNLELGVNGTNNYVLGGEDYVTYTYSNGAATKTKTVVMPVGEVQTTGSTTKSALTGPTVFFPETGVSIKKAWFRVHTSMTAATATNLAITHKVGNNAESAATNYALISDVRPVTQDGYFVHLIPASEYTELAAATASTGKAVQMTAQWITTARGAVSAELVITYQYTSDSNGYLTTQELFAGQQTAAPATSFTTATGAIDPKIAETTGTVTIRGGSLQMNAKNTGSVADEAIGENLTTSTCTATNTSTVQVAAINIATLTLWKNLTSVLTTSDAQTYTACYSSAESSLFSGKLTVTYQWDAPAGAGSPTNDQLMRHGKWFSGGAEQPFTF